MSQRHRRKDVAERQDSQKCTPSIFLGVFDDHDLMLSRKQKIGGGMALPRRLGQLSFPAIMHGLPPDSVVVNDENGNYGQVEKAGSLQKR